MNMALMERLGWRMLKEKDALWSKVLQEKYGLQRRGLDVFKFKSGSSHVWKGIVKSARILEGSR